MCRPSPPAPPPAPACWITPADQWIWHDHYAEGEIYCRTVPPPPGEGFTVEWVCTFGEVTHPTSLPNASVEIWHYVPGGDEGVCTIKAVISTPSAPVCILYTTVDVRPPP